MVLEETANTRLLAIKHIRRRSNLALHSGVGRFFGRFHLGLCIGSYRLEDSFLSELPSIASNFCFGVVQLVIDRWKHAPASQPDATFMSFGHVAALGLLAVPCFAAGETLVVCRLCL